MPTDGIICVSAHGAPVPTAPSTLSAVFLTIPLATNISITPFIPLAITISSTFTIPLATNISSTPLHPAGYHHQLQYSNSNSTDSITYPGSLFVTSSALETHN